MVPTIILRRSSKQENAHHLPEARFFGMQPFDAIARRRDSSPSAVKATARPRQGTFPAFTCDNALREFGFRPRLWSVAVAHVTLHLTHRIAGLEGLGRLAREEMGAHDHAQGLRPD
jgi:hypothetical protein